MPRITINNKPLEVAEGASLLDAARQAGISIPTMCHLEGDRASTPLFSCQNPYVLQILPGHFGEISQLLHNQLLPNLPIPTY